MSCAGLDAERLYLVEGEPGTGKTTLALQFLMEGARRGEKGLYVTLSESERELRLVAKRHGFSLDQLSIFELVPPEASLDPERELTLFHPAELELTETSKLIFDRVDQIKPSRIVFDSLSEMRLLAQNPLRYRRQVLALKHFFPVVAPRCFCWTTFRRRRATFNCTASPTASLSCSKWPSIMARKDVVFHQENARHKVSGWLPRLHH